MRLPTSCTSLMPNWRIAETSMTLFVKRLEDAYEDELDAIRQSKSPRRLLEDDLVSHDDFEDFKVVALRVRIVRNLIDRGP